MFLGVREALLRRLFDVRPMLSIRTKTGVDHSLPRAQASRRLHMTKRDLDRNITTVHVREWPMGKKRQKKSIVLVRFQSQRPYISTQKLLTSRPDWQKGPVEFGFKSDQEKTQGASDPTGDGGAKGCRDAGPKIRNELGGFPIHRSGHAGCKKMSGVALLQPYRPKDVQELFLYNRTESFNIAHEWCQQLVE